MPFSTPVKQEGQGRLDQYPAVSIVDDDESIRAAMVSLLGSYGFAVHDFASVEEFLGSAQLETTSCLIVDVQMPGRGGLDLQSAVAAGDRPIPVIFITAFPNRIIEARALQKGALAYLTKPVDGGVLVSLIRKACGTPPP